MQTASHQRLQRWLAQADNHLLAAQRLFEIEPRLPEVGCFHCQEAAVKYLKAFLIFHNINVERMYNIISLLSRAATFDHAFARVDPKNLYRFTLLSLYPDCAQTSSCAETQYYYELVLQIKALVWRKIGFSGD